MHIKIGKIDMNYEYKFKDRMELQDGRVQFWIEQDSSIHMKVVEKPHNDPVELTADEAREIAKKLIEMADKIDAD